MEAGRKSALGKPAFTPRLSPLRQCAHTSRRVSCHLVRNFEAPLTSSPGKPSGLRDGLLRGAPEGKNRATFTLPFGRLGGAEVVFGYPPFFLDETHDLAHTRPWVSIRLHFTHTSLKVDRVLKDTRDGIPTCNLLSQHGLSHQETAPPPMSPPT